MRISVDETPSWTKFAIIHQINGVEEIDENAKINNFLTLPRSSNAEEYSWLIPP